MRVLSYLSLFAFASSVPSFAAEIYLVEPMICKGLIKGDASGIHDDYTQILMKFTSFKSTRRDGTLADSLEVANAYYGSREKIDEKETRFSELWNMGPLFQNGSSIFRKNLSGRDDHLNLRIRSKGVRHNGAIFHTLTGFYSMGNDVGRREGYTLECEATVVDEVKRIDDNTRP